MAGKRPKKAPKAQKAGVPRRPQGQRQHRGRSGPGPRRMLLAVSFLAVAGTAIVLIRQRAVADIEVPVPPNFESFDPQVRSYIKEYIALVQAAPGEAESYATLGLVYGANEVWREARTCFAHAVRLDPSDPLPRHYHAVATEELGEHEAALAMFRQVAAEFPDFAPGHQHYGVGLLSRGNLEQAAREFHRVIALAPDAPEGPAGLGEIGLRRGDYAGAVQHLEKALKLNPRRRRTHYLLGTAYLKLGRVAQAKKHLSGSINTEGLYMPDPWSDQVWGHAMVLADQIERAFTYLESGRAGDGARVLEEALDWHPDNSDVANNLSIMYMQLQQHEKAHDLLLRFVEHDNTRFETHINLAAAQLKLDDLESALSTIDRAVQIAPQVSQAHLTRARVLLKLRRVEEALEAYQLAAQYDAENLVIRVDLATLCTRLRRYAEAKEHYQAIVQGDPGNFAAYVRLCDICIRLGDLNEAAEVLDTARGLSPDHPDLSTLAARLRARMNE